MPLSDHNYASPRLAQTRREHPTIHLTPVRSSGSSLVSRGRAAGVVKVTVDPEEEQTHATARGKARRDEMTR